MAKIKNTDKVETKTRVFIDKESKEWCVEVKQHPYFDYMFQKPPTVHVWTLVDGLQWVADDGSCASDRESGYLTSIVQKAKMLRESVQDDGKLSRKHIKETRYDDDGFIIVNKQYRYD